MNFFLKGFHENVNSLFTSPYTGKDLFVVVRVVVSVGLSAGAWNRAASNSHVELFPGVFMKDFGLCDYYYVSQIRYFKCRCIMFSGMSKENSFRQQLILIIISNHVAHENIEDRIVNIIWPDLTPRQSYIWKLWLIIQCSWMYLTRGCCFT